jgi:quinol monooxygenase YgiN
MRDWEASDDTGASGYVGGRVLRFRDKPGRYVIQADFESWDAAQANNDRPETRAWAARLAEIVNGEIKYENLDVLVGG